MASYSPVVEGDDVIDAYLYGKTIDPKYGLHRLYNSDAGMHTDYVKQKYPNKDIPVYEQEIDNSFFTPVTPTHNQIKWDTPTGSDSSTIFSNGNITGKGVDVGGFMLKSGTRSDGLNVFQAQDIWKYNPGDYLRKWLTVPHKDLRSAATDKLKNTLMLMGLREADVLGTPVITRTPVYKYK